MDKLTHITGDRFRSHSSPEKFTSEESEDDDDEEEDTPGPTKRKEAFVVKATVKSSGEEAAFKGAGRNPGIEIWRIEKMIPVKYAKDKFGTFANEDSYIVLKTAEKQDGCVRSKAIEHF